MDTREIMELSLRLVELNEVPEDSAIHMCGPNVGRILFCIDAGVPESEQLGYDLVIAHHPMGEIAL